MKLRNLERLNPIGLADRVALGYLEKLNQNKVKFESEKMPPKRGPPKGGKTEETVEEEATELDPLSALLKLLASGKGKALDDEVTTLLESVAEGWATEREELQHLKSEQSKIIARVDKLEKAKDTKAITELKKKVEEVSSRVPTDILSKLEVAEESLQREVKALKEERIKLEIKERQSNFVIRGLEVAPGETDESLRDQIKEFDV